MTAPTERHMGEELLPCPGCGSILDYREGPLGASYQCLDHDCGQTFAPDEIEEAPPLAATPTALPSAEDALREALRDCVTSLEWWRRNEPGSFGNIESIRLEAAKDALATLQSPRASDEVLGTIPDGDREYWVRVLYGTWPHTVISPALADVTGLPLGAVLTFAIAKEAGADFGGLYRYADAIVAALTNRTVEASDEVLGEASDLADQIDALYEHASNNPCTCNQDENSCRYCNAWERARRETRALIATLSASPVPVDASGKLLAWFTEQHRLELTHYSPVYGDDDDQSVEWRVHKQGGSINDREWDLVGSGETALAAIQAAYNSLSHTAPVADAQAGEGK